MSTTVKLMLLSTTILSAGFALKMSAPTLTEFAVNEIPSIYNNVVSWLKPPYLYLVINCIIITIMASSKLQSKKDDDVSVFVSSQESMSPPPVLQQQDVVPGVETYVANDEYRSEIKEEEEEEEEEEEIKLVSEFGKVSFVDEMSNKENESVVKKNDLTEKSPVGKRSGGNRKNGPEGGKTILGVSKPKRQYTLESTWQTITEGRPMPLNRHLKKSDTWERDGRRDDHNRQVEKTPPKMKKSETFNDRTNTRSPSPGSSSSGGSAKVRKESSLSQDELNRRVEAFIKKFNEDMRLQRQESLNQYKERVKRRAS